MQQYNEQYIISQIDLLNRIIFYKERFVYLEKYLSDPYIYTVYVANILANIDTEEYVTNSLYEYYNNVFINKKIYENHPLFENSRLNVLYNFYTSQVMPTVQYADILSGLEYYATLKQELLLSFFYKIKGFFELANRYSASTGLRNRSFKIVHKKSLIGTMLISLKYD